jgi:hypothetical protein
MNTTSTPPEPPDTTMTRTPLPWSKRILCAFLISVPVILALSVPLYQRTEPTLGGIPFFYWFQMLMAVAAACGCGLSYFIAFRNEPETGATK